MFHNNNLEQTLVSLNSYMADGGWMGAKLTPKVFLTYSQVQNKLAGRGACIFFMIFGDPPPPPPQLIFILLFINFSNLTREYREVHK